MAVKEEIYRGSGQVSPATPIPTPGPGAFGAGLGAAIEGAGSELYSSSMRAQRARREREEDAANAQAAVAAAQLSIDLNEMAAKRREEAALDGFGHTDTVTAEADARINQFLEAIPSEKVRQRWSGQAAGLRSTLIQNEDGWQRGRRIEALGTSFREAGRLWDNQLQSNPDPDLFEQSLQSADTLVDGMQAPADVKKKLLVEAKAARSAFYLQGLIEKDPLAAKVVISSGALDLWLDPKDKARLLDASDTEIRIAAADIRRQQSQDEAQLREDVTEFKQRIDRGELVPDEEAGGLIGRAKALGVKNLVDDVQYVQGKAKLSRETDKWTAAEWAENVNELAAKVAGGKASAQEQMTLKVLQELRPSKEARFRNDPEGYAAASGIPVPEVDLANPTPASITAKKNWARSYARTAGLLEPPYLNKDQLEAYRQRANQGPVGQLEVATELRQVWGEAAPSIVRQLGGEPKGDMMIMLGLQPRMAQVYKRGSEALKRAGFKFDEKVAAAEFGAYAKGIPADLHTPLYNAARAIAAGWMDEQGRTDPPANFAEVFRQAIHRAGGMLGSVGDGSATGGFVNWNGHFAWLPADMHRREFQVRIARADPQAWVRAAVDGQGNPTGAVPHHYGPDGKLKPYTKGEALRFGKGRIETIAPGVYRLVDPMGGVVVDGQGRPWQFDIRRLR